jgi:fido (protein-threonine AMPylation protein)
MFEQKPPPVSVANGEDVASLRTAVDTLGRVPRGRLDLATLLQVQRAVLSPSHPYRGEFRTTNMVIRLHGTVHKELPSPGEARRLAVRALQELDESLTIDKWEDDALNIAARCHARITQAHALVDGNGRVARAFLTWVLVAAGYRLKLNPRVYCRHRLALYYGALAAHDMAIAANDSARAGHHWDVFSDSTPWRAFVRAMVACCFEVPDMCREHPADDTVTETGGTRAQATDPRSLETARSNRAALDRLTDGLLVELTHRYPDARLYYTVDGTDPTRTSTPYTGEFLLTFPKGDSVTVKTIAVVPGFADSAIAQRVYLPPIAH